MPVEEQLLPSPDLKPLYDDVVWLYVYNDFKEGEADRAATRIRLRLGVSSWPQLLLVEPEGCTVIGETGREVASFRAAVASANARRPADPAAVHARLRAAEAAAAGLQVPHAVEAARRALEDPDIVVRTLAVQSLEKTAPAAVAERAAILLDVPNDLFRYAVCTALEKVEPRYAMPPAVVQRLEGLLRQPPADSRNPNVLRIHAARALGRCGTRASLEPLRAVAVGGTLNNGLTGIAVDAVAAIGGRVADARGPAAALLVAAFPEPVEAGSTWAKACDALAKRIHAAWQTLTGQRVPFPDAYTAASRAALVRACGGR